MTMIRLLTAFAFATLAAASSLCADITYISDAIDILQYHLRLKPDRYSKHTSTLYWNYTDSLNHNYAEIEVPPFADEDPILGFEATYAVYSRINGNDSLLTHGKYQSHYPTSKLRGLSAIIKVNTTSASLNIGGDKTDVSIPIPFTHNPSGIGHHSPGLQELRNKITYTPRTLPRQSHCTTPDNLIEHLTTTPDTNEAFWTYLDRNTDPAKATLGGKYTIATIAEDDGTYSILYIDGATNNKDSWQPLKLKGILYPTIFQNHFDLLWVESNGRILIDELSADIELNGAILTINIPLSNATVRFRRQTPNPAK